MNTLQKQYEDLKEQLNNNSYLSLNEKFSKQFHEVRQSLIKEYKDYLYNHIEWKHISLDTETEYLDLLSFNQLEKLAIDYDY